MYKHFVSFYTRKKKKKKKKKNLNIHVLLSDVIIAELVQIKVKVGNDQERRPRDQKEIPTQKPEVREI